MSVTYESAMSTLTTMFGSIDPEVIGMILQANNGHMERTVEHLLAMDGEKDQAPPPQQHRPQPQQQPPPRAAQQPMAYQPPPQQQQRRESMNEQKSGPQPVSPVDNSANDIYQLPDDFLRPPSYYESLVGPAPELLAPSGVKAPQTAEERQSQIDQDHLLAQMLNDQQFMEDLANNPERYGSPAEPQAQVPRSQPQAQSQLPSGTSPLRHAPPAHPHPDFSQLERRGSNAGAAPSREFNPSTGLPMAQSQSLSSPLMPSSAGSRKASGADQLPLNDKLRGLESGGVPGGPSSSASSNWGKSGVSTSSQATTFKSKWDQLTTSAREKLSRLSLKFKKDANGANDDYQEMAALHEEEPPGHGAFVSAEEAAELQAGYNPPSLQKARLIDDDRDPFGPGANGSDDEDGDDAGGALKAYLAKRDEQQFSDVLVPGSMPAASSSSQQPVRLQSIQPEAVHLSSAMFQPSTPRAPAFATASEIAAFGKKGRSMSNAGKPHSPSANESDSDDDYVSPAAMAKRKAKGDMKAGKQRLLDAEEL